MSAPAARFAIHNINLPRVDDPAFRRLVPSQVQPPDPALNDPALFSRHAVDDADEGCVSDIVSALRVEAPEPHGGESEHGSSDNGRAPHVSFSMAHDVYGFVKRGSSGRRRRGGAAGGRGRARSRSGRAGKRGSEARRGFPSVLERALSRSTIRYSSDEEEGDGFRCVAGVCGCVRVLLPRLHVHD